MVVDGPGLADSSTKRLPVLKAPIVADGKGAGKGIVPLRVEDEDANNAADEPDEKLADYIAAPQQHLNQKGEPTGVTCSLCSGWLRSFKFAKQYRVIDEETGTTSWKHHCMKCSANERDVPEGEVLKEIVDQRPVRVDRDRSSDFRDARLNVAIAIPMVGASSRMIKAIARTAFAKLVAPLAGIIKMKAQQLEAVGSLCDKHKQLINAIGVLLNRKSAGEAIEVPDKMFAECQRLELEIKEASKPKAFAGNPLQKQFLKAATYADEWVSSHDMFLRSWYLCCCGACISSKVWTRRFMNPWQKRQEWYCCICTRKYQHKFGQLVESKVGDGESCFALAEVPPAPIEDIRAKGLELKLKPQTPAELYDALKMFAPTKGAVLRPCVAAEVQMPPEHLTIDEIVAHVAILTPEGRLSVEANPPFGWYQIFNWV